MTKITVLKGDGIGPEIMDAGLNILSVFKEKGLFDYEISEELVGGAAIDAVGNLFLRKQLKAVSHLMRFYLVLSVDLNGMIVRNVQRLVF